MSDEETVADAEVAAPDTSPNVADSGSEPGPVVVDPPVADLPVDGPTTEQPVEEQPVPTTGEEVPPVEEPTPVPEPESLAPEAPQTNEIPAPPAKPVRWFLVEYRALSGAILPLEAVGKFWHANSQHVLAEACFAKVEKIPGFRAIKDVPEPEGVAGCADCGATV